MARGRLQERIVWFWTLVLALSNGFPLVPRHCHYSSLQPKQQKDSFAKKLVPLQRSLSVQKKETCLAAKSNDPITNEKNEDSLDDFFEYNDDFEYDLDDDSWLEEDVLYSIVGDDDFMEDGPDAFLSDYDLSLLHNISIPNLDDDDEAVSSLDKRKPISLADLKKLSSSALSYFYLRDEIGLSEDAMWKITNVAGSVLGLKASTVKEKVEVLRNTMKLSDDEVRTLIEAQPTLLHLSAKKNLAPTILFLVRQLGLGVQELRSMVLACPSLLTYRKANLNQKLEFFIDVLGYSVKECREILIDEPTLWKSSVKTGFLPRLQFLNKEINIPIPKIRLMVQKNPRILKMSVDNNLQPKLIFYFIMTLHMNPTEVQRVLLKCPAVLNFNLEEHILPITRYFLSLDVSAYEFAKMCLKFPALLTYGLSKIKRTVGYLRFELGLEANDVRRVLYQAPQVVSLSMDNLQSKVEFLKSVVGLTKKKKKNTDDDSNTGALLLRKVIVGMPTLLYLSIESNLGPKVSYLRKQLGGDEELQLALSKMPALLAYSLEKRIKPRMEQLIEAGVDVSSITVGITLKQIAFDAWVKRRAEKEDKTTATRGRRRSTTTTKDGKATRRKARTTRSQARVPEFVNLQEDIVDTQQQTTANDNDDDSTEDSVGEKKGNGKKVVQDGGRIVHWVRRN